MAVVSPLMSADCSPVTRLTWRTCATPAGNGNPVSVVTSRRSPKSLTESGTASIFGGPNGSGLSYGAKVESVATAPVSAPTARRRFWLASTT
jgi:hypothetical protein